MSLTNNPLFPEHYVAITKNPQISIWNTHMSTTIILSLCKNLPSQDLLFISFFNKELQLLGARRKSPI